MIVDVGRIIEAGGASLQVSGEVALPEELAPGIMANGPASVEAAVANTGRLLHLDGVISLRLSAECVRCLARYTAELRIPFSRDYRRGAPPVPDADRPGEELSPLTGTLIELDPVVCEEIFLALPMKPLCREDCPGLCPICGKNLSEGKCECAPAAGHPGLAGLARLLPGKPPKRPDDGTENGD